MLNVDKRAMIATVEDRLAASQVSRAILQGEVCNADSEVFKRLSTCIGDQINRVFPLTLGAGAIASLSIFAFGNKYVRKQRLDQRINIFVAMVAGFYVFAGVGAYMIDPTPCALNVMDLQDSIDAQKVKIMFQKFNPNTKLVDLNKEKMNSVVPSSSSSGESSFSNNKEERGRREGDQKADDIRGKGDKKKDEWYEVEQDVSQRFFSENDLKTSLNRNEINHHVESHNNKEEEEKWREEDIRREKEDKKREEVFDFSDLESDFEREEREKEKMQKEVKKTTWAEIRQRKNNQIL